VKLWSLFARSLDGGLLLILAAPTKYLLTQLPDSLAGSFAYLGRTFAGTDSHILASASRAFAEIGSSGARMQSREIARGPASTLAQTLRPFANVFTALADFLSRAAFSLPLFVFLPGLSSPLLLGPAHRARKAGQAQENHDARHNRYRGQLILSFHLPYSHQLDVAEHPLAVFVITIDSTKMGNGREVSMKLFLLAAHRARSSQAVWGSRRTAVSRLVRIASWCLLLCAVLSRQAWSQAPVYEITPVESSIKFDVESSVAIKGTFQKWDASLTFQTRELSTCVLEIRIQADSVDTGSGMKNGKLKGKDFFNAKEAPYITFRSTKIRQTGPTSFEVDGDFTIRGVTKKETLKVEDSGKGTSEGTIIGTMAFDRKEYGMNSGIPFIKIANRVQVNVNLKWKRVSGLPPAFEQ
jgi:polyisoprenoid-binding protein YceI